MQRKTLFAALAGIIAGAIIYLATPQLPKSQLLYQFEAGPADIGENLFSELEEIKGWVTPCIHPLVCDMLRKVKNDLPRYDQYLREGLKLAAGRKIDFVLFYHRTLTQFRLGGSQIGGEDPIKTASDSAMMVERDLLDLNPDVIGIEGCYSTRCTREQEVEDARRIASEFNIPLSVVDLEKANEQIDELVWYISFVERHPELNVVGVDEIYLQSLDQILIDAAIQNNAQPDRELVGLLYILRSVWAVARMGHLLNDAGEGRSGAIAMGYDHGQDFKVLAQRLGLESRIIVAIPESVPMPGF